MIQIAMSEQDASMLHEMLDAKLVELRREISHTDALRFRETLYQREVMLERLLAQLPHIVPTEG